jgi:hypothetical protein
MSVQKTLDQYGVLRSSSKLDPLGSVAAYYQDFYASFVKQNYGDAYASFDAALRAAPELAYRYFMSRANRFVTDVLDATGKTREVAARLDGLIAQYPNINILCDDNPAEVERVRGLRERNIQRGLPSIAIVAQSKSASVTIDNIFSSGFGLPTVVYSIATAEVVESWARDFARGGACYTTHLYPRDRNILRLKRAGLQKIIVHVRDPRQGILSLIHHIMQRDTYLHLRQNGFAERTIDEQLEDLLQVYLRRIAWLQGWLEAENELDLLFSTFEDFVQSRDDFVARYLDYYGGPTEYFLSEAGLTMHKGTDYHFRVGEIDEWRKVFSPGNVKRLSVLLPEAIKQRFNWPD